MKSSAAERRFLAREGEDEGIQVARSQGSYVFDSRGKKYVDFVMGWCVGNFGWNNPLMRARIRRFRGPEYVLPQYSYKGWAELAELLVRICPGDLTKCFRATGGSEAVDIALQAAMRHTKRKKFMSVEGAYHGNTLAALSVGDGDEVVTVLRSDRIKPPLNLDKLDRVETRLKRREIAAVIMEPISIGLGVQSPEPEFMTGLQRLCRRYGTLLIIDEVATGFGRTGRLFATEYFDIAPDMMCIAKAVTGGAAGLGAVIATDEVVDSMSEGTFYSTYGWHPLSVDVAIANIRWIVRHKTRLLAHVDEMSSYFLDRLRAMRFDDEPEIRVRGLAIAVDVQDGEYAQRIQKRCRKGGLLLTSDDSMLLLLPALDIDRATAKRGLDVLEASV